MTRRSLILLILVPAACTGVSSDPTDQPRPVTGNKRMFVTSTTYQGGNLGGLAGADAKCADRAAAAGLAGAYKAWLSDSHKSAASRLTHSVGSYSLIDGTVVAASWDDLVATNLQHAVDHDEFGHAYAGTITCQVVGGFLPAWTETATDGSKFPSQGDSCGDWSEFQHGSTVGAAVAGNIQASGSYWTEELCVPACVEHASLYCLEQ